MHGAGGQSRHSRRPPTPPYLNKPLKSPITRAGVLRPQQVSLDCKKVRRKYLGSLLGYRMKDPSYEIWTTHTRVLEVTRISGKKKCEPHMIGCGGLTRCARTTYYEAHEQLFFREPHTSPFLPRYPFSVTSTTRATGSYARGGFRRTAKSPLSKSMGSRSATGRQTRRTTCG